MPLGDVAAQKDIGLETASHFCCFDLISVKC